MSDQPAAIADTPNTPAPAADTPAASPAQPSPAGSLLAGAQPDGDAAAEPVSDAPVTAAASDGIPEKFQVKREDGTLDEAATLAKLAKSYTALEAHKGAIRDVPASPEDYKLEIVDAEGKPLDPEIMEGFTGDPLFQQFTKDAHAAGLTNEQMQFVVQKYMTIAPQLIAADKQITRDEASAELSKLWTNQAQFTDNLRGAMSAITAYGGEAEDMAGSRARLQERFGDDPDFLAFAARIGSELKEDKPNASDAPSDEMSIEALQKSPAYWDKNHPDHTRTVARVTEFNNRKHGAKPR